MSETSAGRAGVAAPAHAERSETVPEVTEADDNLHPAASDDPFWTETHWFAFSVPSLRVTGSIYPVFRANQQICSAGVYLWDDRAEADHEILYFQNFWHLPMPKDLHQMDLPGGLSFRCLEPLKRWEVRYDDGAELQLHLVYEGLIPPFGRAMTAMGAHTAGTGHLDQPCRVSGTIRLNGQEAAVDGCEMRDKSWGPRSDLRRPPASQDSASRFAASYTYGLSEDTCFLAGTMGPVDRTEVLGGFFLYEGKLAAVTSGWRTIEREQGRPPTRVLVEAADEIGRSFRAEGTCVNRWAFQATPGVLAWMSGTTWTVDGADVWGQDQEMAGRPWRELPIP